MVELYIKIGALNLEATVMDSDDLSTIRGSSLALLRFPSLLLGHLKGNVDSGVTIDPILASASETVIRLCVEKTVTAPAIQRIVPPFKGGGKAKWRKAIQGAVDALGASDDQQQLEALALGIRSKFGGKPDLPAVIEQILKVHMSAAAGDGDKVDLEALGPSIEQVCRDFASTRNENWPFDYFTFSVASHLARKNESLGTILALLDNRLRRQQQRGLTVALPARGPKQLPTARNAVCRITGVLAADPSVSGPEPRSASVGLRRKSGVDQRTGFYEEQLSLATCAAKDLLGELNPTDFRQEALAAVQRATTELPNLVDRLQSEGIGFAQSFQDIVDGASDHVPPGARSKLAVIYLDGNSFGRQALDRATGSTPNLDGFRRYSRYLEAKGGLLLAGLLAWMLERPSMRCASSASEGETSSRLRFETLLWGGDEMCFVLPAFEAAAFMAILQEQLRDWPVPELARAEGKLSFAAGMAFGHVKTPIRDLRRVAYLLCDAVKQERRQGNWLQVLSLEGIDRADVDPSSVREALLGAAPLQGSLFDIAGENWTRILDLAARLDASLGQTQLHRQYRKAETLGLIKAPKGSGADAMVFRDEMLARLKELRADADAVDALKGELLAAGGDAWALLPLHQLLELWDFLLIHDSDAIEEAA